MTTPTSSPTHGGGIGRRSFLRSSTLVGAGVAGGAVAGAVGVRAVDGPSAKAQGAAPAADPSLSFYGTHQPGITGRVPASMRLTAFDLTDVSARSGKAVLATVLRTWTAAAANMMAGRWIAEQGDTATGLRTAGLTITFGLGAGAIRAAGAAVPEPLTPLPVFAGDVLQPARSGGDLAVSVCADDPLVTASASRALVRVAGRAVRVRWSQSGFSPSAAASLDSASTPRNLMGQLDGTDNPVDSRLELAVWADGGQAASWMTGGTYVVTRRIRMLLTRWDGQSTRAKESVTGRTLDTGAPLSGGDEHATPDFNALTSAGTPVIPADSHLRLTHPSNNSGATMLRRSFSFDDGIRADAEPDAGLFFQAYQSNPHETFVPIQRRLAASDALRHFVVHEASAVFAIAPGTTQGSWIAQPLLGG